MHLHQQLEPDSEAANYLVRCARIRDITVSSLTQRLMDAICADQLVLAILDNDSKPYARNRGDHRFRADAQ